MSGENPMAEESVDQKDLETMTRVAPVGETDAEASAESGPADQIRLTGVAGIGHHGVLEEERRDGQPFLADLVLTVDTRAAAAGDDLTRTVNYAEVAGQVVAVIEGEPVNLIETLAARIAAVVLAHQGVRAVAVTVHKPEAPVGVPFTDVEVTITRTPADDLPDVEVAAEGQTAAPREAAAALPPTVPPTVPPPAAVVEPEPTPDEPEHREAGPDLHLAPEQPVPVVIALGGNVGDVRATLRAVVADLQSLPGLSVEEVSPLARTAAVLTPDAVAQPDYLNAVVLATTTLAPMALLESLQGLENAYGRRRTVRWGERTLDLDLIVYDGVTSTDPELSLPHPRASERAFVLVPWAQAAPDAFLPGLGGGPVATLAETAPDRGGVRWLALDWLEGRTSAGPPSQPAAAPVGVGADESSEPDPVATEEPRPGAEAPVPEAEVSPVPDAEVSPEPEAEVSPEPDAEVSPERAAAEPAAFPERAAADPAAFPERADAPESHGNQWTPDNLESQEDLELLAHGDAEPEVPAPPAVPESETPAPPAVPPTTRPTRASFPPPAEPVGPPPAVSFDAEPAPQPAPAPAPRYEPQPEPAQEPEPVPEPAPSPSPAPVPEPQPEVERRSWRGDAPAPTADADGQNEPRLPWVASPDEGQAPRMAPKWQPLRRNDDS